MDSTTVFIKDCFEDAKAVFTSLINLQKEEEKLNMLGKSGDTQRTILAEQSKIATKPDLALSQQLDVPGSTVVGQFEHCSEAIEYFNIDKEYSRDCNTDAPTEIKSMCKENISSYISTKAKLDATSTIPDEQEKSKGNVQRLKNFFEMKDVITK